MNVQVVCFSTSSAPHVWCAMGRRSPETGIACALIYIKKKVSNFFWFVLFLSLRHSCKHPFAVCFFFCRARNELCAVVCSLSFNSVVRVPFKPLGACACISAFLFKQTTFFFPPNPEGNYTCVCRMAMASPLSMKDRWDVVVDRDFFEPHTRIIFEGCCCGATYLDLALFVQTPL